MTELSTKKPLVRVEVKNQENDEIEILYWEGIIEEFRQKRTQTYVVFPRHNLRHVLSYNIGNFEQVTEDTELTTADLISTLPETQKTLVRMRMRQFKSNLQREPSIREVQKMMEWAQDPQAYERKYN